MKNLYSLLLVVGLAALLEGCGSKQGGASTSPAQKKIKIAFVCNNSSDFWSLVRQGCDFAARDLGNVDVDFRKPVAGTAAAQREILTNLVAGGVDGIAISPIDADNQRDLLNSIATNTLLVCADSDAAGSQRVCYIGTDNVAAGKLAADLLKTALPQGGKVALFVGYLNAQNAKDRIQGLREGLSGSNIQIIDTLLDESNGALAEKNARDTLAKFPDLAGMVGLWSYNGPAILKAARSAGKTGQVKIVCFDEDSDTLVGIVSGEIYGTVVQRPYMIGFVTVTRMAKYLGGDKTQMADGRVFLPAMVITKRNIADFQEGLRKRLGK